MKKIIVLVYLIIIIVVNAHSQKTAVGILYKSHTSKPYIPKGTQVNNDREFKENPQRFISPIPGNCFEVYVIRTFNNYLNISMGIAYSTYSTRITNIGIYPPPVSKVFLTVINTVKYSYISFPLRVVGSKPINKYFSLTGSIDWSYCRLLKSYYDLYYYDYNIFNQIECKIA